VCVRETVPFTGGDPVGKALVRHPCELSMPEIIDLPSRWKLRRAEGRSARAQRAAILVVSIGAARTCETTGGLRPAGRVLDAPGGGRFRRRGWRDGRRRWRRIPELLHGDRLVGE
jgi:hypothetical protein